MACDLTTGRTKISCSYVAGIKAVYFSVEALGAITYDITDTDVITTFAGTPEFFQYDLKGNNNTFDAGTWAKDANTGAGFYTQTLNVQFPILDKASHKELKLLAWAASTVIVQDFDDNYFVMGLINGADVVAQTMPTGGAKGDFKGYTLSMTAEEITPANFLAVDIPTTTATVSAVQTAA